MSDFDTRLDIANELVTVADQLEAEDKVVQATEVLEYARAFHFERKGSVNAAIKVLCRYENMIGV